MYSSSALSSPSYASNELIGFTAVNFQDRSIVSVRPGQEVLGAIPNFQIHDA
jgi:hypothetical protein